MNTPQIAAFLGRFPPFDALPPDALAAVAAAARLRSYAEDEPILVEDGPPAEHLFVVYAGAVDLLHQEEVVESLEPGESFGHPSLLSGLAPAFTVRARTESTILLIPREQALEALAGPAGAGFVARTLRDRLTRVGHTVHALPELGTLKVGELATRTPVFCAGDASIRTAAQVMTEHETSALIVRDTGRLCTVTDAALRARVVTGEVSVDEPVSRIATPAVTVGPDWLAVDAVVEMLAAGAEHVVLVARSGEPLAVLSAADLTGLETRSPFALRHQILHAPDEDALVAAAGNLQRVFLALLDAGLSPTDVTRVLSLQVDTLTSRLLELALERHGPAPTAWAWLALGSGARREFTLGSDQDNAIAFADDADDDAERYFERIAADVNAGLTRCGFSSDANDVVARSPLWRMRASEWVNVFRDCLVSPDRSHLVRANVAFDFRQIAGALEVTPDLVAVIRDARHHPGFLGRIARSATDYKPALGRRGHLRRVVDLKQGGVIPVSNVARFHAFSNGVTISNTLDRLTAVEELGALERETAAALREAFVVIARIRLDHHAHCIASGKPVDNLVVPDQLPPLTRAYLREALRAIAAAQKRLAVYVPLGL